MVVEKVVEVVEMKEEEVKIGGGIWGDDGGIWELKKMGCWWILKKKMMKKESGGGDWLELGSPLAMCGHRRGSLVTGVRGVVVVLCGGERDRD